MCPWARTGFLSWPVLTPVTTGPLHGTHSAAKSRVSQFQTSAPILTAIPYRIATTHTHKSRGDRLSSGYDTPVKSQSPSYKRPHGRDTCSTAFRRVFNAARSSFDKRYEAFIPQLRNHCHACTSQPWVPSVTPSRTALRRLHNGAAAPRWRLK